MTSIASLDINRLFGLYYFGVADFKWYQLLTNFFLHANLPHIMFNMVSLWSIGPLFERLWGSHRFLMFYLLCGLGAGILTEVMQAYVAYRELGHFLLVMGDQIPTSLNTLSVGASGAIYGLFIAVAVIFPNLEFYMFFIPIPIKAKFLAPALIGLDLFLGLKQYNWDPIGHFAHIGGALTGFLVIKYWNKYSKKFY
jgi:rhomboid-like protein